MISVPALFELPQSSATSEAARLAGFARVELLQEPIASALAAGWRAEDDGGGTWLVFDLGGGTFDASLLETRDGLLRVVGHDGDNFLGGRDFDWAITEHLASQLAVVPRRNNPDHAGALRALRLAAEDAKIELSRGERAQVALAQPLSIDGQDVDVDLELTRATVERLCTPLVDRALDVCVRLLAANGLGAGRLAKIVLVGGPTVMPMVRQRVAARLEAPIAEGHDPMTLVAQGAALYAATAGLDGRAASVAVPSGRQVWLQYPAVSADLTPHVVGKFVGEDPPAKVKLVRSDGAWSSPEATVGPDGTFLTSVTLLPRRACTFADRGARPGGPARRRLAAGADDRAGPDDRRSAAVAHARRRARERPRPDLPRARRAPARAPHVHAPHGRDRREGQLGQRAADPDRPGRDVASRTCAGSSARSTSAATRSRTRCRPARRSRSRSSSIAAAGSPARALVPGDRAGVRARRAPARSRRSTRGARRRDPRSAPPADGAARGCVPPRARRR